MIARLVVAGSTVAVGLAAHTVANLRHLRRPQARGPAIAERVSVLVPARNEAAHVGITVAGLLDQAGVPDLEVIVLDDGSTDATPEILGGFADPRLTVVTGADEPPPPGWLGKPWACARLAERATGSVLVFADADVAFGPHALRAAVAELRAGGFALVSPFPREVADDWLGRLVQPLLTWSWAATLPLRLAETLPHPSLSAANGQFLVFDADAYRRLGGHAAVAGDVLEDLGLARAVKAAGGRAAPLNAAHLASCRMYATPADLVDGYGKSLWAAFGGPAGSLAVTALLGLAYVVPPLGVLLGGRPGVRLAGAVGYAAGVAGRAAVAARVANRVWPDAAAHPASIAAFAALNGISWWRRLRGTASWKGRPVTAAPAPAAAGRG
nr:glycosyltransferase [Propionibacterium sp.]